MSAFQQPPAARPPRRNQPVTLEQAAHEAPMLAHLLRQAQQSQAMLALVQALVPPGLFRSLRAGAVENQEWCLFVANAPAAAKLRQLTPALTAHLRTKGYAIQGIRVLVSPVR